jgi:hypothetical protein
VITTTITHHASRPAAGHDVASRLRSTIETWTAARSVPRKYVNATTGERG